MKKILIITFIIISIVLIVGCTNQTLNEKMYSDDDPIIIELEQPELKILQLTDLHLFLGFDYQDRKTFKLIEQLIQADTYDFIVVTGDVTMSPFSPMLYRRFIHLMETFEIPWTFIFGNHDTDLNKYQSILNAIPETTYLKFKVGPMLEDGGVGNFKIDFTYASEVFYHLYFLDSKGERLRYTKEEGKYDYLSEAQVLWYEEHVKNDFNKSIVFMHTPLRQLIDPIDYVGIFNEIKVYAQGKDTGFFDMVKQYSLTEAIFFGHDHLNDFYTIIDDVMLGYGRTTGYNAYGNLKKGGRVFIIDSTGFKHTCLVLEGEAERCV